MARTFLDTWRGYTDEDAFVFANTDGEPHNTITPIARKVGDTYEFDLALRNNITTEEHPLGVYHPHAQWHNIKKENIGLIEVMGLAVLPSRSKRRNGNPCRLSCGRKRHIKMKNRKASGMGRHIQSKISEIYKRKCNGNLGKRSWNRIYKCIGRCRRI